jgi:threonine dehydrogenase-like Zn-dependent dehydrogenase
MLPMVRNSTLLVSYGGLLKVELQAGDTNCISGATGNFGSSAIAVAFAIGASYFVAPDSNEKRLNALKDRFGSRLRTVILTGNEEEDRKLIIKSSRNPIDLVFDILPPGVDPSVVRTALMAVRPFGRVVLMGGVGMQGGPGLELPYPWIIRNCVTIFGQWMYPPKQYLN